MRPKATYSLVCVALTAAMFVPCAPLLASEADEQIVTAFRQTYAYKTYLKDDAIRTDVKDGFVVLIGTVPEESHKTLAQATVANLSGVVRVDNQLVVGNEAIAATADVLVARRVGLALRFHRDITEGKISVAVKDGVVTLRGEASSPAQRDLIVEFVSDITGVKEVRNEMTAATALEPAVQTTNETLDDASITAQIVTTLMTHRSTSSVITRVSTHNGEVTLTGIAKNDAQSALIARVATNIRGVTGVKNQMTVENEPRN